MTESPRAPGIALSVAPPSMTVPEDSGSGYWWVQLGDGPQVQDGSLQEELCRLRQGLLDAGARQLAEQERLISGCLGHFDRRAQGSQGAAGPAGQDSGRALSLASQLATNGSNSYHFGGASASLPTALGAHSCTAASTAVSGESSPGGSPGRLASQAGSQEVSSDTLASGFRSKHRVAQRRTNRRDVVSRTSSPGAAKRNWFQGLPSMKSFYPTMSSAVGSQGVSLGALSGLEEDGDCGGRRAPRRGLTRVTLSRTLTKVIETDLVEWLESTSTPKEPERLGPLADFVDSRCFHSLCVIAIVLNGMFIFWQTNANVHNSHSGRVAVQIVEAELFFLCWFGLELLAKIAVHRMYFFIGPENRWNLFDITVVVISLFDFTVTYLGLFDGMNITFLRVCRLLRVSKVLRIFRAFRFLSELRLLLTCLMNCFSSLFWSGVLLLSIKFLFGLFFVQSVTGYIEDEWSSIDPDMLERLLSRFGSVQLAMLSLLKITTGGENWNSLYDLLEQVGLLSSSMLLFYIVFFMVAVWNIVTSVFIEKIMVLSAPDLEEEALERRKQRTEDAHSLLEMAHKIDKDGTGNISLDEFLDGMRDETLRSYFSVRGIEVKDGVTFFKMLSTVNGMKEVPLDVFVHGCLRLRGPASGIDLHTLNYECKLMHRNAENFQKFCSDQFKSQSMQTRLLLDQLHEICGHVRVGPSLATPSPTR